MDNLLQQGISAAKAGDRARAFQLLKRATQDSTMAEQAWLWLSGVVDIDAERLFCLDNALRINPNNGPAQSKATALRQKGIFPSTPTPPYSTSPASDPLMRTAVPQPTAPSQSIQRDLKPYQPKVAESPLTNGGSQQDHSALYKFAAMELAKKQSTQVVVRKLTDQGVTPAVANKIVNETQKLFKRANADKYKKRMTRGLLWTVVGIILTCGTMAFASNLGGKYILFYGAIIYGIIDLLVGLVGWLSNK